MKSSICALLIMIAVWSVRAQKPVYEIEVRRADTSMGKITVEMFPAIAPNHVRNWDSLVAIKFYDSLAIHRVVPDWVIQGGDPNTRSGPEETWGFGSDDQTTVDAEFSAVSHLPGILSQARTSDPNSGTSQFFICLADNSVPLDRKYSVYGQVISGMDVVRTIEKVDTGARGIPVEKIIMFITKTGSNDAETAVPELALPAHDSNFVSTTKLITFRWHPVPDAMLYRIQVAKDADFTDMHRDTTTSQTDTSIRLSGFQNMESYYWRVLANNGGNASAYSSAWQFSVGDLSVSDAQDDLFSIEEVTPHPILSHSTIRFGLAQDARVSFSILDLLGNTVRTVLQTEYRAAGIHQVQLDATGLPGGVYLLLLEADGHKVTTRLIVE